MHVGNTCQVNVELGLALGVKLQSGGQSARACVFLEDAPRGAEVGTFVDDAVVGILRPTLCFAALGQVRDDGE
jgi:hypothetical protein